MDTCKAVPPGLIVVAVATGMESGITRNNSGSSSYQDVKRYYRD
jgi:hypothetical protein